MLYPRVLSCCEKVLQRMKRNSYTKSRPVFYRSALFSVLSPESPVFLVDIMKSRLHETSVYFSLYNISYRYDIESKWLDRFARLVKFGKPDNENTETVPKDTPTRKAESLTKVRRSAHIPIHLKMGILTNLSTSAVCNFGGLQC